MGKQQQKKKRREKKRNINGRSAAQGTGNFCIKKKSIKSHLPSPEPSLRVLAGPASMRRAPSGSAHSATSTETRWHSTETSLLSAKDLVNQKMKPSK